MTAMGNGKMKMGAPDGAEVSPEKRFKLALVSSTNQASSVLFFLINYERCRGC